MQFYNQRFEIERVWSSGKVHAGMQGVATGWSRGQIAPLTAKFAKNQEKERERKTEKWGKEGKNREKEEKSGRFFHFAPPDRRAGYATECMTQDH